MEWLEDYTGIGYPFDKYDFVVIPDFQYGGMEHAGATLYNDRRIFLSGHPTTEELMERASLIAHETAHMWFGDYVKMCVLPLDRRVVHLCARHRIIKQFIRTPF